MTYPPASAFGLGAWPREPGTALAQASALPSGATSSFVILSETHAIDVSTEWEPHFHDAHELLWAREGTLTAQIEGQIFTVSEGYGLWIPARKLHGGRLTARIKLFSAFFAPERSSASFRNPTVITMEPLLESLLVHLSQKNLDEAARARAESVVFDVLKPSENEFALRLPDDPRISAMADQLLADPADQRSLDQWAVDSGVSARTITRAFRESTGLSFAQWRQAVKIHRALELLASGESVQDVSDLLGYAQPSTFIDAFRRIMGCTPGVFTSGNADI
ncbi:AraC family transcriptional regulator [Glutamicibacter sp. FBE19]|uniref:helix-turn-helix domain-containing protein n=1 Tax=Glutamicibacter sp. FBE19 TaxID=2761534 RepID=UPI0018964CE3|nr:AraC family transcriptional regulator [Glutamicibacter sp. FBE19]MBF6670324.1 helix-turn-helix transcriptional regulator [Glutamicibacter sp. FBE19]